MDFEKLVQQPESARDERWEHEFLDGLLEQKVEVVESGAPVSGPDGWPYLRVKTGGEGESFRQVVHWLSGRGIGLVVNAHKMAPDYVFTYGMLWNFVNTGLFVQRQAAAPAGQVDFKDRPIAGPPSESYLPSAARGVLRDFLEQQGLKDVRVLVATTPDYKQADLVFSLESLGELTTQDQRSLAEAITWFLPLHYSIVFASEQNLKGWVSL